MAKKKLVLIIAIAVVVIAGIVVGIVLGTKDKTPPEETYRSIKLYEVEGSITVNRNGTDMTGYEQMALKSNDKIVVGADSHAIMKLDEDKYVYAFANTVFTLVSSEKDASKTVIKLSQGELTTELTQKLESDQSFEVETPNSTMAIRGTVIYISVTRTAEGNTNVGTQLLEGTVEITLFRVAESTDNQLAVTTFPLHANEGFVLDIPEGELLGDDVRQQQIDANVLRQELGSLNDVIETDVDHDIEKTEELDDEKFGVTQSYGSVRDKTYTVTMSGCYAIHDDNQVTTMTVTYGTIVKLKAEKKNSAIVSSWAVNGKDMLNSEKKTLITLRITQDTTVSVSFVNIFSVIAIVEDLETGYVGEVDNMDSGSGRVAQSIKAGDSAEIEATPNTGYVFAGWYDKPATVADRQLISTDSILHIESVTSGKTYYAVFEIDLTSPDVTLVLDAEDSGLFCEFDGTPIDSSVERYGEPIDLSAILVYVQAPNDDKKALSTSEYTIDDDGFGDSTSLGEYTITYTLVANTEVSTSFTITLVDNSRVLTVYHPEPTRGTVVVGDTTLTTTEAHEVRLLYENVPISATAAEGFRFVGWFATPTDSSPYYEFASTEVALINDLTLYALFEESSSVLSVYLDNVDEGTVSFDEQPLVFADGVYAEEYDVGTELVFLAQPLAGYTFYGWYTGLKTDSTAELLTRDSECYYTVTSKDYSLYARFCGEVEELLADEGSSIKTAEDNIYFVGQSEELNLSSIRLLARYSVGNDYRYIPVEDLDMSYEVRNMDTQQLITDWSSISTTVGVYSVEYFMFGIDITTTTTIYVVTPAPAQGVTLATNGLNDTLSEGYATSVEIKPTSLTNSEGGEDSLFNIAHEIRFDGSTDVMAGLKADAWNTRYSFRILAPYYLDVVHARETTTAKFSLSIPDGYSLYAVTDIEGTLSAVDLTNGSTGMVDWQNLLYDADTQACSYRFVATNDAVFTSTVIAEMSEQFFYDYLYTNPFSAMMITVDIVTPLIELEMMPTNDATTVNSVILDTMDTYYSSIPNSPFSSDTLQSIEEEDSFVDFAHRGIDSQYISNDGTLTLNLSAVGNIALMSVMDSTSNEIAFDEDLSTETTKVVHVSPTEISTHLFTYVHDDGIVDITLYTAVYNFDLVLSNKQVLTCEVSVLFAPSTIDDTVLEIMNIINSEKPLSEAPLTAEGYGYSEALYDLFFSEEGTTLYTHETYNSEAYVSTHNTNA